MLENILNHNLRNNIFLPGVYLVIGQMMATVVSAELEDLCESHGLSLSDTFRIIRNWLIPLLSLSILVSKVWHSFFLLSKIINTLLWIAIINTGLSLVDEILFISASRNSWRGRVPRVAVELCRGALIVIGFLIVLAIVWGIDVAGISISLGVGTLAVGLALQDTLSNIFSGIIILLARPFDEGDYISIENVVGEVFEIGWRSVKIMDCEGRKFIIPHQKVAQSIIKKFEK